jgi:hypothetical protein
VRTVLPLQYFQKVRTVKSSLLRVILQKLYKIHTILLPLTVLTFWTIQLLKKVFLKIEWFTNWILEIDFFKNFSVGRSRRLQWFVIPWEKKIQQLLIAYYNQTRF